MSQLIYKNYISGEFKSSDNLFDDISPFDGSIVARVSEANKADVDLAVRSARKALTGVWSGMTLDSRCALISRVADEIDNRFDDFVSAEIADTGKPLNQAKTIDIPRGAENFRFFSNYIKSMGTELFDSQTHDGAKILNYSIRKPKGVIAIIAPWNLPLLLLTWKLAPALAAGNCVIAKPSEETPGSATLLAEVFDKVGFPPGVFNLLHGFGPASVGEYLTKHSGIDAITFTGESSTGSEIMKAAAPGVKALSFELGGKNPAIIFDDADLDAAVNGTIKSVFSNCGQVCLCTERVYVQSKLYERFMEKFTSQTEKLIEDWPEGDASNFGPLISEDHRKKVLDAISKASSDGGNLITGGGVPEFSDKRKTGFWIEPTIFTGLDEDSDFMKNEIFGPVCHVSQFDSEDEVLQMANDTDYGLAAAVWTTDLKRAHSFSAKLDVGIVWINSWYLRDLRTPFGGTKLSGIGREGGHHSIEFYSEISNICLKL